MKKGGGSGREPDRQRERKSQRESRSDRGCSQLISLHRSPSAGHPWWDDITALCQMTKKALTPQEAKCNPMNPGIAIIPQKALKVLSLSLWWLVDLLSVPSWLKLTLMCSKEALGAFYIWNMGVGVYIFFLTELVPSTLNTRGEKGIDSETTKWCLQAESCDIVIFTVSTLGYMPRLAVAIQWVAPKQSTSGVSAHPLTHSVSVSLSLSVSIHFCDAFAENMPL